MCEWLSGLTLAQISWITLVVYLIHYAEEGPRLVAWFANVFPLPGLNYTQAKLNVENILLFGLNLAIVILLNLYPDNWFFQGMILSAPIGFIGNTVFHAIPTLKNGVYSPGVVTASMLNPPMFALFCWKAAQMGILTWPVVTLAVVAGIVMLPIVIWITHNVIYRDRAEFKT